MTANVGLGSQLTSDGFGRLTGASPSTKSLRDRGACFGRCADLGFVSRFVMLGVCC